MASGLNAHYHLMLAVINACSLLLLRADVMMASLALPLRLSFALCPKSQKKKKKKNLPCESCLRMCHITRGKKSRVSILLKKCICRVVDGRLQEQTFLAVCSG